MREVIYLCYVFGGRCVGLVYLVKMVSGGAFSFFTFLNHSKLTNQICFYKRTVHLQI